MSRPLTKAELTEALRQRFEWFIEDPEKEADAMVTAVVEYRRYLTKHCPDCGAENELAGHQTCPYPQDHA